MGADRGGGAPLGDAIAHYGRIAGTLHILRPADEPGYRRQIKVQANLQEGRHALARKIFHGKNGQLYQRYQDGMEDQTGALGLVLNALVLFNTRCLDQSDGGVGEVLGCQQYPVEEVAYLVGIDVVSESHLDRVGV